MLQADHTSLTLSGGDLLLVLSPGLGGAIRDFSFVGGGGHIPLLRPARAGADAVLDMASFPLVPFVNRIRGGRFSFRGRDVVLAPNMTGDFSPLHGQGWLGAWTVESAGDCRQPVAVGDDVIVGEGDDFSLRVCKPGIACVCAPRDRLVENADTIIGKAAGGSSG